MTVLLIKKKKKKIFNNDSSFYKCNQTLIIKIFSNSRDTKICKLIFIIFIIPANSIFVKYRKLKK